MASVLLLLSQGDHSTQAKGNFNPTYSVSLCNSLTGHPNGTLNGAAGCADVLTTGANPNLTTNFGVPVGDLNFGFLAVMFDGDFTIAADAA
ncbi:MAG: hypothetical protein HY334_01145, partial [Armatimonadetes bacterium]|nr:hypothetical protein [Armatimonadota bacterium]